MFRRRRPRFDARTFTQSLADYGKQAVLKDWSNLDGAATVRACAPLRDELNFGPTPKADAVTALRELATHDGGWVAVGVWRFLFWDYDAEYKETAADALNASARAIGRDLGIRNAYWFMETAEIDSYRQQFGEDPPRGMGNPNVPEMD